MARHSGTYGRGQDYRGCPSARSRARGCRFSACVAGSPCLLSGSEIPLESVASLPSRWRLPWRVQRRRFALY
eukprot:15327962-Alexandrium_andersonii.AAC.1